MIEDKPVDDSLFSARRQRVGHLQLLLQITRQLLSGPKKPEKGADLWLQGLSNLLKVTYLCRGRRIRRPVLGLKVQQSSNSPNIVNRRYSSRRREIRRLVLELKVQQPSNTPDTVDPRYSGQRR
ncbi:unnamed protein product [Citrullus colocynthis]|uniref:Uncharacterized protein n=1 Tax=Citrullus colocynthis TaxID=252529 RepID=A0ABP0YV77_9ROSI